MIRLPAMLFLSNAAARGVSRARPVFLRTLIGLFASIIVAAQVVSAQTDFPIHANSPILKAELQKELDKWMVQAYEGDTEAQFKVGVLFANDQFNSADYEQAVYWYKQAARQGHTLAQYNLGHQYLTGVGVDRSEVTAMNWWLKAAENDHPLAQFNVGRAYYLGIGLQQDLDLSKRWFEQAAQNQEPRSIEILEQLGWAIPGQYQKAKPVDPASEETDPVKRSLLADQARPSKPNTASITPAPTRKANTTQQATSTPSPATTNQRRQRNSLASRGDGAEITSKVQPLTKVQPLIVETPEPQVTDTEQGAETEKGADTKKATKQADVATQASVANASSKGAQPTQETATQNSGAAVTVTQRTAPQPNKAEPDPVEPAQASTPSKTSDTGSAWRTNTRANSEDESTIPATLVNAIAVYTNPAIRSVLIAVLEQRAQLQVVSEGEEWTAVTSRVGFPVWVSGNYVNVNGSRGTITGSSVNARSVPIVINGTVVGKLDKNEIVSVLESRGDWYRIQSPTRFKAWVKTSELETRPQLSSIDND